MTRKKKNAPTAEHIDTFWKAVAEYQMVLNLQDWRIEKSGKSASRGAFAEVNISDDDRLAVIALGADYGSVAIDDALMRSTALHEVLHVFLRVLIQAARSRDDSALGAAEHSVVVILEKLLGT